MFDVAFIVISLLSVACCTGFRRFEVSMTAETRRRVNTAVDSVPAEVIPAMGEPAVIFGLITGGGLQLDPHGVTVVAITLPVAHGADIVVLVGHLAVIGRKKSGMVEFAVGKIVFGRIMAIDAEAEIFPFFFRMLAGRHITAAHGRTGKHKPDSQENGDHQQNLSVFHSLLPHKPPRSLLDEFLMSVTAYQQM
jgi:hypothetical protein